MIRDCVFRLDGQPVHGVIEDELAGYVVEDFRGPEPQSIGEQRTLYIVRALEGPKPDETFFIGEQDMVLMTDEGPELDPETPAWMIAPPRIFTEE